eukprot:6210649-Pleurochrysis_carterae.AAC.3
MAAHAHGQATHRHAAALRHRWRLYRVIAMTSCDATLNGFLYCTYIDGFVVSCDPHIHIDEMHRLYRAVREASSYLRLNIAIHGVEMC